MDEIAIRQAIKLLIKSHKQVLNYLAGSQTKLLELGAITGFAQHYKSVGFSITPVNPFGKTYFAVKTSTKGDPWNFSRFLATKGSKSIELHMNVLVRSAHDHGIYCVDVGVTKAGSIPVKKPKAKWKCLPNSQLVTFGEAKKLVVYPMLLAQFVGIVHEIKPKFLHTHRRPNQLPPVLIALGHYSANASAIVNSYPARGIQLKIAEGFDARLAKVLNGTVTSPFA